jgi:hypothetical protein
LPSPQLSPHQSNNPPPVRGVDAIYSGTNPTNALHAAEDRKEIEDAYAILSTNNKRQAYDICKGFAHLASPLAPTPIPARVGRPRSNTKVSVSRDKRLAGSELDFAIDGSGLKAFGGGDLKAVDSGTVKPIGEKKENQKPEN